MKNVAIADVRATLTIKKSELDFVLDLLGVLKLKGLLDFKVEDEPKEEPPFREITVKELNAMIERAENQPDISVEEFKAMFGI